MAMAKAMAKAKRRRSEFADLSEADHGALERCIEAIRQESPSRREEVASKLANEGWRATAEWACWCCQDRNLRCKPWQWVTPGRIKDVQVSLTADPNGHTGERGAAEIVRRLFKTGLTKYEDDPLAALEVAEGE